MQRTGRKGAAQFRVVVQDSRRTPTSGNIIALVGHYDPHAKTTTIDKEKITFYLSNGAQPSDRVIRILQHEKVEIPKWVKLPTNKTASVKNQDKLRKNRPKEEVIVEDKVVEEVAEAVAEAEISKEVDAVIETEAAEVAVEEAQAEEPEAAEVEAKEESVETK
jgi:small subunit ribosomal protein S16